jgi:hypothetical protein
MPIMLSAAPIVIGKPMPNRMSCSAARVSLPTEILMISGAAKAPASTALLEDQGFENP